MSELTFADTDPGQIDIIGLLEHETDRGRVIRLLVSYIEELLSDGPLDYSEPLQASDISLPPQVGEVDVNSVLGEVVSSAAGTATVVMSQKQGRKKMALPHRMNPREERSRGVSANTRKHMRRR